MSVIHQKLKFAKANAKLVKLENKLKKKIYSLDLLSGITCPGALKCLSKAIETPNGRRIQDGIMTEYRCFSASQEVFYTSVYNLRKYNTDLIRQTKGVYNIADLILQSMPKKVDIIRYHVSGDWQNQQHFDAAIQAARELPNITFYCYTKSLKFWVRRQMEIPDNFNLTASFGGRYDELIEKYRLRYCKVVFSKYEARKLRLPIDHDDSYAATTNENFALLLHGTQAAGTRASRRWNILKKTKQSGYSRG